MMEVEIQTYFLVLGHIPTPLCDCCQVKLFSATFPTKIKEFHNPLTADKGERFQIYEEKAVSQVQNQCT